MPEPTKLRYADRIPCSFRVFEYMIEHAFDMAVVLNADRQVVFASPSSRRLVGRFPGSISGRDLLERVHPGDRPRAAHAVETAMKTSGFTGEPIRLRFTHEDGTLRTLDWVVQNRTDDPSIGGVVVNIRDASNESEALSELRKLKERYEKAFQKSPDSITMSRVDDGLFLEVNDGFVELTGFAKEESIGHTALEIGLWRDPERRKEVIVELSRHGHVTNLETEFVTKPGKVLTGLYSAEVVEMGGKPCLLSVTRDITEMKEANRKLFETGEELRREHIELARKNIALQEILDHLEREKAAFRHELSANVENLLRPIVKKLQAGGPLARQDVETLASGLDAIVGHDIDQHQNNMAKLTPRELDICDLIRLGKTSKEMADTLGLSDQTVHKHRQSIRRKLQLDNRGINLAAYLRSR